MLHKLLFLLVFFFVFPARSALVDRIMAIINDDIITLSDIQEFKKNVPTSELPSDKAILDILIEDRLTKQLIKKLNLAADEEEISSQISSILKNQGLKRVVHKRPFVSLPQHRKHNETSDDTGMPPGPHSRTNEIRARHH